MILLPWGSISFLNEEHRHLPDILVSRNSLGHVHHQDEGDSVSVIIHLGFAKRSNLLSDNALKIPCELQKKANKQGCNNNYYIEYIALVLY